MYSGLLECPMTTRISKVIDGTYTLQSKGKCNATILTFQECYHAAATTLGTGGQTFINSTGSDPARPAGCSASADPTAPFLVSVFFNTLATSSTVCGTTAGVLEGAANVLVNMTISLNASADLATITLAGPSAAWFGVGFDAIAMGDQPWTLIVDGDGAVTERKLGGPPPLGHVEGSLLTPSVKVVSTSAAAGVRTVTVTRRLQGITKDYYTFDVNSADPTIDYIVALGNGPTLAYHKLKMPSKLTLLPVGTSIAGSCVCPQKPKPFGQASGSLVYHAVPSQAVDTGAGKVGFRAGKCKPFPATVLNEMENPTCDIRHYQGGQWSCHHMWSLLDAEQEIPWPEQPLVMHAKWRFYVQPFTESYHKPIHYGIDTALVIGSPYEYDVPKCTDGVPGCSLDNGTWIHTITGNKMGVHNFAAINFHCHAPTCLSMAVYACEKNTPLDQCNATNGKLICKQKPVYGGTGNPALAGTRFDEPGYIAIPDCLWGDSEFGLEAPPNLTNVPLHIIKTANATWAHYGEMAGGQPFVY
jgi:hypothetical protein